MDFPRIYRKRFIPLELISLDKDTILHLDDKIMVSQWNTIHPKHDLSHGSSLFMFDKGYKISKFYSHNNSLLYYYCDIVTFEKDTANNSLIICDLLADIIIKNDGSYEILDLDELGDALMQGLIDDSTVSDALHKLNNLIQDIKSGAIHEYLDILELYENISPQ